MSKSNCTQRIKRNSVCQLLFGHAQNLETQHSWIVIKTWKHNYYYRTLQYWFIEKMKEQVYQSILKNWIPLFTTYFAKSLHMDCSLKMKKIEPPQLNFWEPKSLQEDTMKNWLNTTSSFRNIQKGFFPFSYLFSIIFWESLQFRNFEIEIRVKNEVPPKRFLN